MSEYMEKHTVSRGEGSPPGYVGFEDGGQLTEAVRRKPYSVILFDEIEKAHSDIFNILLQILDDGRITDAKGKLVDFKNTIIIATSNIGSETILEKVKSGVNADDEKKWADLKSEVLDQMKLHFRPEFLNRVDEIILFHPLDQENLRNIVKLMIEKTKDLLDAQGINLKVSDKVLDLIIKKGYLPEFGARPMKRVIQKEIESPLSKELLEGNFVKGDTIIIETTPNESFSFSK
jgi:ATP-dependent Clp protease ATP-binding subunit ClpC